MLEEKLWKMTVVSEPELKMMDCCSSGVLDPEGSIATWCEPDFVVWYPVLVP